VAALITVSEETLAAVARHFWSQLWIVMDVDGVHIENVLSVNLSRPLNSKTPSTVMFSMCN
jgi:hypothetical protein